MRSSPGAPAGRRDAAPTSYGDEAVGEAVALDPAAFTSGHDTAGTGEMIACISGIAFVVLAGLLKKVPVRTAFIGGLLAILPPWMFGGVGGPVRRSPLRRHPTP